MREREGWLQGEVEHVIIIVCVCVGETVSGDGHVRVECACL